MINDKVDLHQFANSVSPLPSFAGHTTDYLCGFQAGVIWLALVAMKPGQSLRIVVAKTNVTLMTEVCQAMRLTFHFERTSPPVRSHMLLVARKENLS